MVHTVCIHVCYCIHVCCSLLFLRPFPSPDVIPESVKSDISGALLSLVPLLPLVTSSASLHWFLRQIPYYCPQEMAVDMLSSCLRLLIRLVREREEGESQESATAIGTLLTE